MSRRLKVGVAGGGVGAAHVAAYLELPELYSVEAFCDIDPAKARAVAEQHQVPKSLTSFAALLDLDLDVVDIATPSSLHFSQAVAALKAGRNVVLEKPVASCLADVDELKRVEAASGKRVVPIFQYRFGNGLARLKHLIAKGVAGKPLVATAETHWRRTAAYYAAAGWRGTWAGELGGTLATHAIHIHDLLMQVLGPVASVYARTATRVNEVETEDCAVLAVEFAVGAFATSSVTLGSEDEISRLRFCFEGLTAESGRDPYNPAHEPWTLVAADEDGRKRIDEALADFVPGRERWVGQMARTHAALTQGYAPPVSLDDGRAAIELLTAAYDSALSGEAVRLPIGPDHRFYRGWISTMTERKR
ncbi:MAG: Gfo/Idh/MocA family oxidoreductase [Bauldia sp.]